MGSAGACAGCAAGSPCRSRRPRSELSSTNRRTSHNPRPRAHTGMRMLGSERRSSMNSTSPVDSSSARQPWPQPAQPSSLSVASALDPRKPRRHRPLHGIRPPSNQRALHHVLLARRTREACQRKDRRHQAQHDRRSPKRLNGMPNEMAQWVHPSVIGALVTLLGHAGATAFACWRAPPTAASRSRTSWWTPAGVPRTSHAAKDVEFENHQLPRQRQNLRTLHGPRRRPHVRGLRPQSGLSRHRRLHLARQAQGAPHRRRHAVDEAASASPLHHLQRPPGPDEPDIVPVSYRAPMHSGSRTPPKSAPQPVAQSTDPGFRVPRIVADLVASLPSTSLSSTASTP